MEIWHKSNRTKAVIRFCYLSLLMLGFISVALCQQGGVRASSVPVLNYKLVGWPTQANSAAGFPAGPWNFIQVASVATTAAGNILVLHRGAHPIMEFEPGGKFVRSWGDGMISEGKVMRLPTVMPKALHAT